MTDLLRFVEGFPLLESGVTFMRVVNPLPPCNAAVRFDESWVMSAQSACRVLLVQHPLTCMVGLPCSPGHCMLRAGIQHGTQQRSRMQVGNNEPNLDGRAKKEPCMS